MIAKLADPVDIFTIASPAAIQRAQQMFEAVCMFAGSMTFLDDIDAEVRACSLERAVLLGQTAPIFDWLLTSFSYSGISDKVARDYAAKHGTATWSYLKNNVVASCSCPKLQSYWNFCQCGYDKTSGTCAEPDHIQNCPVPRPRLRNGRLNSSAASMFLFVRDVAGNDLIGWIESRMQNAVAGPELGLAAARQEAILGPLRNVFGIGEKLICMAFSTLLIGLRHQRPFWFDTGKSLITVDTLVHNFCVRTGILDDLGRPHAYGPACYRPGGCAAIIRAVSERIDTRQFNRSYPAVFPRFVQHAVWRFCAADGLNICNGNQIDDRFGCVDRYCRLGEKCDRKTLKYPIKTKI